MSRYIDIEYPKLVQTTADVEPIVKAHWIMHERAEEVEGRLITNYECSHCHEWFRDNRRRCGECGAKMGEEVKEDAKVH